jgi:cyclic beta-1,2-glucan synthetase
MLSEVSVTSENETVESDTQEYVAFHGVCPDDDEPLRAELLPVERLAEHARALAATQQHAPTKGHVRKVPPLIELVTAAEASLAEFNDKMATAVRAQASITPAIEWLLDNSYLVDEQIREIHADLPGAYFAKLPKLVAGPWAGYPRVWELAVELLCHTDSSIDRENLTRYVMSYQELSPLNMGEVWAIPIMLRAGLVENLRRLAARVASSWEGDVTADGWADRLVLAVQDDPASVNALASELVSRFGQAPASFLLRLSQRLQGLDVEIPTVGRWLEMRLAALGDDLAVVMLGEQQRQAADQVSIANAVTAIRFLGALDWRAFFEDVSLADEALREDPVGVYDRLDFPTRDRYRHALEGLSKRCPLPEVGVARAAVEAAREALAKDPSDSARGHVGYHLISGGRYEFERRVGYQPLRRELTHRGPLSNRGIIYFGSIGLATGLVTALLGLYVLGSGSGAIAAVAIMLLTLVPVSDLVLHVANRIAAGVWPPRALPRLDFQEAVPDAHRTLVVVPALVTSPASAQGLVDRLEVHHLSNSDPNIHFAILADLKGGDTEKLDDDEQVVEAAVEGIRLLNDRYAKDGGSGPFHLFLRGRRYNAAEEQWMGWERKRGAIKQLNNRILGEEEAPFSMELGDESFVEQVTFVLTLDADTALPRDAAKELIGTIAHPLNRAQYDPAARKVLRGYALVQPRVSMSLAASRRSIFSWLYSGPVGVDPYAGAVSDTYQDVFGEGSFTGKAIYDVAVFAAALKNRIPENQLLSHDLLEGCFVRTALASDIEVYDDYPATYAAHTARLHRWVRGDWQTLPWLFPMVRNADGTVSPNPLSWLSRWKLFDNLRRSLFAPIMLFLFSLGWLVLPGQDWVWSLVLLVILLFPVFTHLADSLLTHPQGVALGSSLQTLGRELGRDMARALFTVSVLPHQAYMMADAIVRALWRQLVSRKGLLEWETAAEAERRVDRGFADILQAMWPSEVLAVGMLLPTMVAVPGHRLFTLPLLLVWLSAPLVTYRASRPGPRRRAELTEPEARYLRRLARKTWRFFERFVTEHDHWLAPDNYQEDPKGEVAHRTSPTNMGLQLLVYLAAYDLGWLGIGGLSGRVGRTLATVDALPRFRGHFFNWYDTLTLEALPPGYVSTVDSGNLAGYLAVLRVGLVEAAERPLLGGQLVRGLEDAVRLAIEEVVSEGPRLPRDVEESVQQTLEELLRRLALEDTPKNLGEWARLLSFAGQSAKRLQAALGAAGIEPGSPVAPAPIRELLEQLEGCAADIERLAPWARELAEVPSGVRAGDGDGVLGPLLDHSPSLVGLAEGLEEALAELDRLAAGATDGAQARAVVDWSRRVAEGVRQGRPACASLLRGMRGQAETALRLWQEMDFEILYDESRKVFSIGYNTAHGLLDNSYYDLLASECRLASFLAIAKGDVPQEHWFRLGRRLVSADGSHALVSWSASMFEYLMPLLVMRRWRDTLLDQTYEAVVRWQIQYGRERGVPWGVSESAFNAKDVDLTYQYQAFGVPGLGLKRGLSQDIVIAPYSTVLAMLVDRRSAVANLGELARQGAEGAYGLYEALDYTPGRVPAGKRRAVVKAYMAHHQGMILLALGNELTGHLMQQRFHREPVMRSAELLLQERVPRHVPLAHPHEEERRFVRTVQELPAPVRREYKDADTPTPATHFLSNGRYSVMVTNAGGGYSRWEGMAVSRYREDVTRDCWGTFLFVRDTKSGKVWSSTYQPAIAQPDEYEVIFSAEKAEFRRRDGEIETETEFVVSPEDDVEIRRLLIGNRGQSTAELDVTSYLEVSLAPQAGDQAHKAFLNLFVETEALGEAGAILFTRRPRSADEEQVWGFHVVSCEVEDACRASTRETDRARFLGRLGSIMNARALAEPGPLSNTTGAVLDPVAAIRAPVKVRAGETLHLAFATGVARSREEAVALAEKYQDIRTGQRAAELAWTTSQIELRDLGITPDDAVVFERLASRLLLTDAYSPLKVKTPVENGLPMSALWSLGISGDLPILLVKVERLEHTPLVRQALLAHQYWRYKGLVSDLVILNTRPAGYADELEERLKLLVRTGHALQLVDKPGGVYIRRSDHIPPDILNLLETLARAVVTGDAGSLSVQLDRRGKHPEPPPRLRPAGEVERYAQPAFERPALDFDNGYGGFDARAGEYVIVLEEDLITPAPWVNVMANPVFGSMVSEAGVGCTWALNSHENRLTTWNNDPVTDGSGELFYLRDEDTGEFWSPTPAPVREAEPYVIRHGRGYTCFSHTSHGIEQEMEWFVAVTDPVRVVKLKLTNRSGRNRAISATHLVEWVLGDSRSKAQHRVVTHYDAEARILTAHNHFNVDFPGRAAFLATDVEPDSYTASRTEFLGRNGHPGDPAAMHAESLGAQTGRFIDNCGAMMVKLELAPGEGREIVFLLGQTETLDQARDLVARYRKHDVVERAARNVRSRWSKLLDAVSVRTPDKSLDLMVNGWLLYQALSCRMWGRTALYQSSGAFGFRDQLQDGLAFLTVAPELLRDQIIEAARHQFVEGDVMHWWLPPAGRGVRTRITDDRHWLAFAVAEYIDATGDASILDVEARYVEASPLGAGEDDAFITCAASERVGTIYEHCIAALERGRETGPHGLPLMGGGDWNDGMNRVGHEGTGESVWLAWFLDVVLRKFAELVEARGEKERAKDYRRWASDLVSAIEEQAWDGAWYRRAYFDDGTPLGTRQANECRIDSVAQSWAAISGAGDKGRARRALESVEEHLVRWEDRLILLLAPPFHRMEQDPGYIKGYVPGVRENGGQYTHAALWVVLAHLLLGDGDEALSLLRLLSPARHASTRVEAETYAVEPYVVPADVYAVAPHVGRGGWTWYTGSAAWFYQVSVRYMLGLKTVGDREGGRFFVVDPCIPKSWPGFEITYRVGRTTYEVSVENPRGVNRGVERVTLDGAELADQRVPIVDDGATHQVTVALLGG